MVFSGIDVAPSDSGQQTFYKLLTGLKYLVEIILVVCLFFFHPRATPVLFERNQTTSTLSLLVAGCLILIVLSYVVSALHKNIIWKCVRCLGFRSYGLAAVFLIICMKLTQIALIFVYLDISTTVISSKNLPELLTAALIFRSFNRLFSAPFACAIETILALYLQQRNNMDKYSIQLQVLVLSAGC